MVNPPPLTDEERWAAVLARDRRWDGAFVFGVQTTGIYCRPSCPARRPRREHVAFFDDPGAAERAGLRPCKRCAPGRRAFEAEQVERVCRLLDDPDAGPLTLDELAAAVGLSSRQLARLFQRVLGMTPRQYVVARRRQRLKAGLKRAPTVTAALYDAGFGSSSRLYENAAAWLGMTPGAYHRGGQGMDIRYTVVECRLGWLLAAATPRGLCAVSLGDTPQTLEAELRRDFPAAAVTRDDPALSATARALARHLDGEQPELDLPLDVQATAFQARVWAALRSIPYGESRTYRQIAAAIGQPGAARAVGNACAHNPVSLVIPCHRAVREDGGLGGYRWGVARKRALLERERQQTEVADVP